MLEVVEGDDALGAFVFAVKLKVMPRRNMERSAAC